MKAVTYGFYIISHLVTIDEVLGKLMNDIEFPSYDFSLSSPVQGRLGANLYVTCRGRQRKRKKLLLYGNQHHFDKSKCI
jgi:hypothetical protein